MSTGYRSAIERLRGELEKSPDDVRLLQKISELFQKAGDSRAAAESFAKVANCYVRDGYQLKAVALLKQVLRLAPGLVAARDTLATTLNQLGLKAEAVEHLKVVLREYAILERADDTARVAKALADLGHHFSVEIPLRDR